MYMPINIMSKQQKDNIFFTISQRIGVRDFHCVSKNECVSITIFT